MTEQNFALNRTLAHLIQGGTLTRPEAVELVARVDDECRAKAWSSTEAQRVAADAQAWQELRATMLPLIDDPHVWDDGAGEAEVLARWVRQLAAAAAPVVVELELAADITQPMATLEPVTVVTPTEFISDAVQAPKRPCGGAAGQSHRPHVYERRGEQLFCPGSASIPHQHGPDTTEQDRAS